MLEFRHEAPVSNAEGRLARSLKGSARVRQNKPTSAQVFKVPSPKGTSNQALNPNRSRG